MKAAKGRTTAQSAEVGEAQLVAYDYEEGSRPTSTMTSDSVGVTSSTYDSPASPHNSTTG